MELLLPTNGSNKTNSEAFDVTVIVVLIINCTTLPPPVNGWHNLPLDSDATVAANVVRARAWRNFLNHTDANTFEKVAFNSKWKEAIAVLQGLGGSVKDMGTLRTISLDPKHELVMRSLMDFNRRKIEKVQSETKVNSDNITDLHQRLNQQNQQIIADVDVLHNKIEEKTEEIKKEMIGDKENEQNYNLMSNQLNYISTEVEQLKNLKNEFDLAEKYPGESD